MAQLEVNGENMMWLAIGLVLMCGLVYFGLCPFCGGGGLGWDGECTDEITDECCEDIRYCNNQIVDDWLECGTFYCANSDNICFPVTITGGNETQYKCSCKDIDDVEGFF